MQLFCNFLDLLEQSNTHPNLAYQLLQAHHPLKSPSERYFSLILPTFSLTIELASLANQPLPFLTIGRRGESGHNRHCRVYCWNAIAVSKTLLPIVSWIHGTVPLRSSHCYKNTIHPLFIVTKWHTTLTTILTRMHDVMLHEEAIFYDNCISNKYIAKKSCLYTVILYY